MYKLTKRMLFLVAAKWIYKKGPVGAIYLTFDDGPYPERTDKILKILENKGVSATFFMIGEEMDRRRDIVTRVIQLGHSIGYHSYEHKMLNEMSRDQVVKDLECLHEIQSRFDNNIKLYRPPYGELSAKRIIWCILNNVKIVLWTVDSMDSFAERPEDIINNLNKNKVRDGDIILMHDDTEITVEALPGVIDQLQGEYKFGVLH